jgi:hypothetical protein
MTIKEKIQNLVLNAPEDINKVNDICEELNSSNHPKELLGDLFNILENNPHFNFGMPGNLIGAIEKHYKEPDFQDYIKEYYGSVV